MTTTQFRRALITGASEGIGRALAVKLAERGYAITAVARNADRLDSLLALLGGSGHRKIVADLTTEAGLALVAREITDSDHYSLLANNAGFGSVGDFVETPLSRHREMVFLNITTLVELTYAFLTRAERGDGVIEVSSVLGYVPMPSQPVYSATKAFVASFSESLWFECRRKGVTVVNLAPGSTATEFPSRAGFSAGEVPRWATESAETVAENAIRAYERKARPTAVSGRLNRGMLLLARLFSRKQLIKIMGSIR